MKDQLPDDLQRKLNMVFDVFRPEGIDEEDGGDGMTCSTITDARQVLTAALIILDTPEVPGFLRP